jgi:hypothetical protein
VCGPRSTDVTTVPFGWMSCPPSGTVTVAELVGLTATIPIANRLSQADPTFWL